MTSLVAQSPLVALVGNPNCGKTALFNLLTGSHQKVANYAGVTVERKEGVFSADDSRA
jgi:ferrous iron transport protein B